MNGAGDTTSINDIVNNSGFSLFSNGIEPLQIVITLLLALAMGLFVYFIYKKTFAGVMYSRSFNLSLVMLTMVTSMVIMLISSNLTLSLGMVGALSIVRFRTAVKDPIDTVFMFWAIGVGIALGAKFYEVAIIASVVIGLVMVGMTVFKMRGAAPFLLVLHYNEAASGHIKALVKQIPKSKVKSRVVRPGGIELILEVRVRAEEAGFVDKFLRVDGVYDASLISYEGDVIS
jgi:hypothetical protein